MPTSAQSQAYFRNGRLAKSCCRRLRNRLRIHLSPMKTGHSREAVNERALSLSLDHGEGARVALLLPWEFHAGGKRLSPAVAHPAPWALKDLPTVSGARLHSIISLPLSANRISGPSRSMPQNVSAVSEARRFVATGSNQWTRKSHATKIIRVPVHIFGARQE